MKAWKRLLGVIGLLGALTSTPSHAFNVTIDPLLANESFTFGQSSPSFSDTLTFKIGEPLDFVLSFTNLQLGSSASLIVSLGGNPIVGTFGRNLTWSWGPFGSIPAFPVGTEFVVSITGTDSTSSNASYSMKLETVGAPVPEASSWMMMAAGLLAIGVITRRRMNV